jgi:hypothetical protein
VRTGPIRCPETSVNNYHTTPHNTPEDCRFHRFLEITICDFVQAVTVMCITEMCFYEFFVSYVFVYKVSPKMTLH